jgi:hypothetical protein
MNTLSKSLGGDHSTSLDRTPSPASASAGVLRANLRALSEFSPDAARAIEAATPLLSEGQELDAITSGDEVVVRTNSTDDGVLTIELVPTGAARGSAGAVALASRRRPVAEAEQFASSIDLTKAAVIVVGGFGAGYHVREAARRVDTHGLVVVFEPDVRLLRTVLGVIDHSAWLGSTNLRMLVDPDDRAAMSHAVSGAETLVSLGVQLVEHGPSRRRQGGLSGRFIEAFTTLVDSARMTVLTALVQVKQTFRNATQNIDVYAASPGVDTVKGTWQGRPAIVVAAGPSLVRNMHLLSRPGVRERVVIVAVQTVLKPLLRAGIKPHFVTALDHSEISRRFYEGLSTEDVEGIRLVIEPKVNGAVIDAWPGDRSSILVAEDGNLDRLLGEHLAREKGVLTPGSTVAHLAYYFARHLGADPVAFIGQDLGFTDGQYYADGAAVHTVWSSELSAFNTLEMMEWQRILRMGSHLRRVKDVDGRDAFSDAQMTTYLAQFERDFKTDEARGLSIIDASEGGVRKLHTRSLPLATVLEDLLAMPCASGITSDAAIRGRECSLGPSAAAIDGRLRDVRQQVWRVGACSRRAQAALQTGLDDFSSRAAVDRALDELDRITTEVMSIDPGYALTQTLAQIGSYNRLRADRLISLETGLSPIDRQRRQMERDVANVAALESASKELCELLDDAIRTVAGGTRVTAPISAATPAADAARTTETGGSPASCRTGVIVPACGNESLVRMARERPLLVNTLARVLAMGGNRPVGVVTDVADAVTLVLQAAGLDGRVCVIPAVDPARLAQRHALVAAARRFSRSTWRGGLGGVTCFDAAFEPVNVLAAMNSLNIDGAALVGPTWTAIDPRVLGACIERLETDGEGLRLTFVHGPPGLGASVIHRALVRQIGACADLGLKASIGSMLAYNPHAPVNDLIASTRCVTIEPSLRDCGRSLVAESDEQVEALMCLGMEVAEGGGAALTARRLDEALRPIDDRGPVSMTFAIGVPHTIGPRVIGGAPQPSIAPGDVRELFRAYVDRGVFEPVVTFGGGHDEPLALEAGALAAFIGAARAGGARGVHVRTMLGDQASTRLDELLASEPDVISIDLLADTAAGYATQTGLGLGAFGRVQERVGRVLQARREATARGRPMLVCVRLTRCDASYEELELFHHRWIAFADSSVIDPLPQERPGERVKPLTLPAPARLRMEREELLIDGAGRALQSATQYAEPRVIARLGDMSAGELWTRVRAARAARGGAGGRGGAA